MPTESSGKEIEALLDQVLAAEEQDLGPLKPVLDRLGELLSVMSGVDLGVHEDFFVGETMLPEGLAVSPLVAAKCLQDLARTRAFMGGVNAAIADKLERVVSNSRDGDSKGRVDILYAGTGPYGLLLLPLLLKYQHRPISVTLIDLHHTSIDALRKVIDTLGLGERVEKVVLADATRWQPDEGVMYDIIISETMKSALKKEPQLFMFSHLQQFLEPTGVLIPEKVTVSAWLTDSGREARKLLGEDDDFEAIKIGTIHELNRDTATEMQSLGIDSLRRSLVLPEFGEEYVDLKYRTDIQVYKHFSLEENQSDLTMPEWFQDARLQSNMAIDFAYVMEPYPRFVWRSEQRAVPIELASYREIGSLRLSGIKRIWSRARQEIAGQLDREIQQEEWSLDLALVDCLAVNLETWIQYLYANQPSFAQLERWLLEEHGGAIHDELRQQVDRLLQDDSRSGWPSQLSG